MSWYFRQSTGELWLNDEPAACIGYAGCGPGKNNPAMQAEHNVGPLPVGKYTIIGKPYESEAHGPYVLRLQPHPENEMFGRAGFLIHGDSISSPGTASEGCIIAPRKVREQVWASGDRDLEVLA